MASSCSTEPCIYPNPTLYRDFFLLRLPITINGEPTVVQGPDTQPVLHTPVFQNQVKLFTIVKEISFVLKTHGISLARAFCDKNYPLLAIEFSPQDICEHIRVYFCKIDSITQEISSRLETMFKTKCCNCSTIQVKVQMELYLCSPGREKKLQLITSGKNARFYVDRLKQSDTLHFPSLMEDTSAKLDQINRGSKETSKYKDSGTPGASRHIGQVKEADTVKYRDLCIVLKNAADRWHRLGINLKVPSYQLRIVRSDHDNSIERLNGMLDWANRNVRITWDDVVQALCDVDERNLAGDICSKYDVTLPPAQMTQSQELKRKTVTQMLEEDAATEEVRGDVHERKQELLDTNQKMADLQKQIDDLRKQTRAPPPSQVTDESRQAYEEIQDKLHNLEIEYKKEKQLLKDLLKYLTEKTHELQQKSSKLQELERKQQDQSTFHGEEDQLQSEKSENVDELEIQICCKEEEIKSIKEEMEKLETITQKTDEVTEGLRSKKDKLQQEKDSLVNNGDKESEVLIAIEIEIIKLNIELVEMRSEHFYDTMKLESYEKKLEQRSLSIERKRQILFELKMSQRETTPTDNDTDSVSSFDSWLESNLPG